MASLSQKQPTLWQLKEAMDVLQGVREQLALMAPDIEADPDLYGDMMESEGGEAMELLDHYIRQSIECNRYAEMLKRDQKRLKNRQLRFERKRDYLQTGVLNAMKALGLKRQIRHDFSVSVTAGRQRVIADVAKLSQEYLRHPDPEPDKAKLMTELKAGKIIAGARLVDGEPSLRITVGSLKEEAPVKEEEEETS